MLVREKGSEDWEDSDFSRGVNAKTSSQKSSPNGIIIWNRSIRMILKWLSKS